MFMLTFLSTVLILSRGKAHRSVDGLNVDGSKWDPFLFVSKDLDESPSYDIIRWFCEEIGPSTSIPAEINSLWSRWSSPKCNNTCGRGFLVAVASCQDQVTGKPAIDCIGPGSFCCPDTFGKCYCEVNIVGGVMKVARFTEPCISTEGCISSNTGTFTFEGEFDPGNSIDFDEAYENDDRERLEDTLCPSESVQAVQRHLLQTHSDDQDEEYGLRENRLANGNFKGIREYRPVLRKRLGDDADYVGQNEDDDDDDDEDGNDKEADPEDEKAEEDDEDEEDEENRDETIGLRGSAKGRRGPRKRIREARSDYAAIAFEGKPEVNELGRKGPMEIRAVTEDCEDDSTEPLQYYDYDSGGNTLFDLRIGLVLPLVGLSILIWFFEF